MSTDTRPTRLTYCPVCGGTEIRHHCPASNTTCTWEKCPRTACAAVLDPRRGRGFIIEGNKTRALTFGPAA